jgi:hypothetical protein
MPQIYTNFHISMKKNAKKREINSKNTPLSCFFSLFSKKKFQNYYRYIDLKYKK